MFKRKDRRLDDRPNPSIPGDQRLDTAEPDMVRRRHIYQLRRLGRNFSQNYHGQGYIISWYDPSSRMVVYVVILT